MNYELELSLFIFLFIETLTEMASAKLRLTFFPQKPPPN